MTCPTCGHSEESAVLHQADVATTLKCPQCRDVVHHQPPKPQGMTQSRTAVVTHPHSGWRGRSLALEATAQAA